MNEEAKIATSHAAKSGTTVSIEKHTGEIEADADTPSIIQDEHENTAQALDFAALVFDFGELSIASNVDRTSDGSISAEAAIDEAELPALSAPDHKAFQTPTRDSPLETAQNVNSSQQSKTSTIVRQEHFVENAVLLQRALNSATNRSQSVDDLHMLSGVIPLPSNQRPASHVNPNANSALLQTAQLPFQSHLQATNSGDWEEVDADGVQGRLTKTSEGDLKELASTQLGANRRLLETHSSGSLKEQVPLIGKEGETPTQRIAKTLSVSADLTANGLPRPPLGEGGGQHLETGTWKAGELREGENRLTTATQEVYSNIKTPTAAEFQNLNVIGARMGIDTSKLQTASQQLGPAPFGEPEAVTTASQSNVVESSAPSRVALEPMMIKADASRIPVIHVTELLARRPERLVEISLSPRELGSVKMSMTAGEGSLTLVVTAERGETLDLMRRHIDTLAQEFRRLGFSDLGFEFTQNDAPSNPQVDEWVAKSVDDTEGGALDATAQEPIPPAHSETGLDLRI